MNDERFPIAWIRTTADDTRPVYEDARGQFVHDDDLNRVYGVWYVPRKQADTPLIAEVKRG